MYNAVFNVYSSPESLPQTETIRFGGLIHPHLKIALPIETTLQRSSGLVRAVAQNLGIYAIGRSSGEALHALGRALAQCYLEKSDLKLRCHVTEQIAKPAAKSASSG